MKWRSQYIKSNPDAKTVAFFRACHARLRRKILEITEPSESPSDIKISPADKKMAADIHNFVMKKKKKGKGVETIIRSPHMMKYMEKFKYLMDTCSEAEMDYFPANDSSDGVSKVIYQGFPDPILGGGSLLRSGSFDLVIRPGVPHADEKNAQSVEGARKPFGGSASKRFNEATLEVIFKGHSIADVLDLSVRHTTAVFKQVLTHKQRIEVIKFDNHKIYP